MFSITLKRSAATLGVVVAGLLAAAGPASAGQPLMNNWLVAGVVSPSNEAIDLMNNSVKAPTNAGTQIGIED